MIILKGWEIHEDTATWTRSEIMWDGQRHTAVITVRYEAEPERMRERVLREIEDANPGRERKESERRPAEPGMYAALAMNGRTYVVMRLPDGGPSSRDIEAFAAGNPAAEFAPEWIRQAMSSAQPAPGGDRQDAGSARSREDIEGWPHAPSRGRLERAGKTAGAETLKRWPDDWLEAIGRFRAKGGREELDAAEFLELDGTAAYEAMAARELSRPGANLVQEGIRLAALIQAGCTETSIALSVERTGEGRAPSHSISRLPRDPDWMGRCRLLAEVRGRNAVIIEANGLPGRPGSVTVSGSMDLENFDGTGFDPRALGIGFPAGTENRVLREILKWHGAADWIWVPQEKNVREDNGDGNGPG